MFKIFIYDLKGNMLADMNTTPPPIKGDFIELVMVDYEVLSRLFNYCNNPNYIKLTVKKVNI